MRLVVITPVGPEHEGLSKFAANSVKRATLFDKGPFSEVFHKLIDDSEGRLGRSHARNLGMIESDWYFFLDADDVMEREALSRVDLDHAATFGKIKLNSHPSPNNVYPLSHEDLFIHGANGTLVMGCFVKSDVARKLRFNEDLDAGEDFDFYMRLPNFIKIKEPLVTIGYDQPSAGGPRGYKNIDWWKVCQETVNRYR